MDIKTIKQEVILNLKEDSSREENIERLTSLIIARICELQVDLLIKVRRDLSQVIERIESIDNNIDSIKEVKEKYCRVQESKG